MHPIDSIFLAFCVYLPILTVIYVVQMWIIGKSTSMFRGSFYWLYFASGVIDILFVAISFPEFRWAIYPISNGDGMVASGFALFRMYLSFVCPIAQDFFNCFIALNRLTAIALPMRHQDIWKILLPFSIIFSLLASLAYVIPYTFKSMYYTPVPMGEYVIYLANTQKNGIADWYNVQIFGTVLELTINCVTLSFYVGSAVLMRKIQMNKKVISDRKLLVFGFAVFAVNIPGLTLQVSLLFKKKLEFLALMGFGAFPRSILPALYYNLAWVTDVKCFAAPITMLIVNDSFRRETLRTIIFWKKASTKITSTGTLSTVASSIMLFFVLLLPCVVVVCEEKLLFAQVFWRHGLRTPIDTYANDPYNEAFFGVPDGELLAKGMEQHFIRGQELRNIYVDDKKLVSTKYSRYETYVRSADFARCSQSALANLAGFYEDSPTYPSGVVNWPSSWTPIPIHTVPHDEDHILEGFDKICPKLTKLQNDRTARREFQDFVASNWRLLHTINVNSGDPEDYSFMALGGMYQSLSIEKDCNLTFPDWVTDQFYSDLETAVWTGNDYTIGEAGFGLPMDPEMIQLNAGFLLKDWMDNIEDVVNGNTTLKYYAYSGHDIMMNSLLIGLGMKGELVGPGNADYASAISCEVWKKDGQYFIKLLFSPNIDSGFQAFTRKLPGCGSDMCLLSDFQSFIQPFLANDVKICEV